MSSVILGSIVMKRESKSFTDSMYAILTASGLFTGPKYMLSALSGMAFKFTVHKKLLPMSVTAYGQWGVVHQEAIDSLGIFTESDGGRTRLPTFHYYQQEAVKWIKSSIDRGMGVIYWLPEFGVIHGYDDEDQVLYVQDGKSGENSVVLYDNLGFNMTPFWYIQIFGGKVDIPLKDRVLEAMRMALDDWETPHRTLPDRDIASGRLAYSYLIQALEEGDYDEGGAVYILESYMYSRVEILKFLGDVRNVMSGLDEALGHYEQLVTLTGHMRDRIHYIGKNPRICKEQIPGLLQLLTEAGNLEEQAMSLFREVSSRYPDPKRTMVPRWGTHTPR